MCCSRSPFLLVPTADCLSNNYLQDRQKRSASLLGEVMEVSYPLGFQADVPCGEHCEERQAIPQDSQCERFVDQTIGDEFHRHRRIDDQDRYSPNQRVSVSIAECRHRVRLLKRRRAPEGTVAGPVINILSLASD